MIKFNEKNNFLNLKVIVKNTEVPSVHISKEHASQTISPSENTLYLCVNTTKTEELNKCFREFFDSNKHNLNIDFEDIAITLSNFNRDLLINSILVNAAVWSKKPYCKKTSVKKETIYNFIMKNNKEVKHAMHLADSINFTRLLQDTPANEMNALSFCATVAQEIGQDKALKISILDKKDIENLNMGLLLSVNRGSTIPPRVMVIEYMGNPKSSDRIALVGKGVTYDTGGYAIKPASSMENMKFDMSGGAIVAGAMKAIGHFRPKNNVVAIIGLTDNQINSDAAVLGDVMYSMNGKTVEMKHTDAEGRLVLADCITYAIREKKATKIIELSTLTGATLVALGGIFAGCWATDDEDWRVIKKSAKTAVENIWRMPFHSEFTNWMKKSAVADLVNSSPVPLGGGSTAAAFLKEFTENVPFIHFDIEPLVGSSNMSRGNAEPLKTVVELVKNL